MDAGDAGIWDGRTLRLWSLGRADLPPRVMPLPEGPDGARPEFSETLLAGTGTAPRQLPCTALPEALSASNIPPLAQDNPRTVTRGEEVTMAGFIAGTPKFDGILCLPGPQSTLWAHVSAEEIVSMRRFLTGTMLRATLPEHITFAETDRFLEILSDTMSRPENVALRLSEARTRADLREFTEAEAHASMTAALIGAELAATRPYWLGQMVALIGTEVQRAPYRAALSSQFVPMTEAEADPLTLRGFTLARKRLSA
ncbi:2-dehydro-3-deoxygalactonokinase [Celeribacter neptunius]|uniref:2-dehydro-3-deoxygalactonokinase n=1 Tax=Celeribacter neptunius TaxID=588602 RepID=A0A1I3UTC8_9RHOB|nr:2-dehydro-3-deoxygalactonokinase [Celeribacter neptunius]SFJ86574.1 2-dehydro-3-deoxygalactonokinase [Celeribacter neptunius]